MESPQAAWRAAVTLALSSLGAAGGAAAQTVPAPVVDPAWLKADTATRTAGFELIAGLTGLNGALNFNGFRDGGLTLTVPKGWTVAVHFRNHDGMLPHSAEVIADVHPLPLQPQPSAFDRAFTLKLAEGLPPEATDDFRGCGAWGGRDVDPADGLGLRAAAQSGGKPGGEVSMETYDLMGD